MIQRGDIWWACLPDTEGSSPGYRRPILVIQSDDFNRSRIATVMGVILTSNLKLAQVPGNVLLTRKATGLSKVSVANVSQMITMDKHFLTEQIGTIPHFLLEQIENGLRLALGL